MTEHKSQHYVPRFYLRNFSSDGVGLNRISADTTIAVRRNIDRLCTSFYFYVRGTGRIGYEQAIGRLEEMHANIIRKIISQESLQFLSIEDRFYLDIFILLMRTRTIASKADAERVANQLLDTLKPYFAQTKEAVEKGITPDSLDSVRIVMDGANHTGMLLALNGAELIGDLEMCLLDNRTKDPLITSDNPVVLYNYIIHEDFGSHGLQSPGLIILLPLNRRFCLILYDRVVNRMRLSRADSFPITRRRDVDRINKLQIVNAESFVIADSEDDCRYAKRLLRSVSRQRSPRRYSATEMEHPSGAEDRSLIHFRSTTPKYRTRLSFIKADPKVSRFIRKTVRGHKGELVTFVRDRRAVEIVDKRMDEMYSRAKSMRQSATLDNEEADGA